MNNIEEKFECLRNEFDSITDELCCCLEKLKHSLCKPCNPKNIGTYSSGDEIVETEDDSMQNEMLRYKYDQRIMEEEICNQENKIKKLQQISMEVSNERFEFSQKFDFLILILILKAH